MKWLFSLLLSLTIFAGCAAKAEVSPFSQKTRDMVESQNKSLSDVKTAQEGLVNAQANLKAEVGTFKKEVNHKVDQIEGDLNSGSFSGGGPYLTIVAVTMVVAGVAAPVVIIILVIKSRKGWEAFRVLRSAAAKAEQKANGSGMRVEDIRKEFMKEAMGKAWLCKHAETNDLFDKD